MLPRIYLGRGRIYDLAHRGVVKLCMFVGVVTSIAIPVIAYRKSVVRAELKQKLSMEEEKNEKSAEVL